MATEKNISSRIIHKHDTEANWNKATNFIPKAGEIIVYDRDETYDYERFKIGDGETAVMDLPFGSIQPDWNQNDENTLDYVKNRPFYMGDPVETVLVENDTVEVIGELPPKISDSLIFEEGKSYKVIFNGELYECIAKYKESWGTVYIGNGNMVNEITDDTEPFAVASSENGTCYLYTSDVGTFSIVISAEMPEIHKIDTKYLPQNVTGKEFEIITVSEDGENITETVISKQGAEIFNDYINNKATGSYSHAEGNHTTAYGDYSHAEGGSSSASGAWSHAEGNYTIASGDYSHTEGGLTRASGWASHAEGQGTRAFGDYSHAEGGSSEAQGHCSHSSGYQTVAHGDYSHSSGYQTVAYGDYSHTEGYGGISLYRPITISGDAGSTTYTVYKLIDGIRIGSIIRNSETDTYATILSYDESVPSITVDKTLSDKAINSQRCTLYYVGAVGNYSHTEGYQTLAYDESSHTEGYQTLAYGMGSHAEGYQTQTSGMGSHAEGRETIASGPQSHAEGRQTIASGDYSHTEGYQTVASGACSHAEGFQTIANNNNQHVQGRYNIEDTENKYAHIVGNGGLSQRSNLHTLDWFGNAWFRGDVYVGSDSGINKDVGSVKLLKESDLVQPDWNQNDETALDFIKNKPDIATDDEIIEMLTQEDMFPVVTDADGAILSDENDNILLW